MPNPRMKRIRAWAVCFVLNKKCLQGEIPTFSKRKDAKTYIKELHSKDGGFVEDHHIVPVLITPINPKKS